MQKNQAYVSLLEGYPFLIPNYNIHTQKVYENNVFPREKKLIQECSFFLILIYFLNLFLVCQNKPIQLST